MTTNKISFISMMLVVGIIYLTLRIITEFDLLDFAYLISLIISFIRFKIIRKNRIVEEWQTFFFCL